VLVRGDEGAEKEGGIEGADQVTNPFGPGDRSARFRRPFDSQSKYAVYVSLLDMHGSKPRKLSNGAGFGITSPDGFRLVSDVCSCNEYADPLVTPAANDPEVVSPMHRRMLDRLPAPAATVAVRRVGRGRTFVETSVVYLNPPLLGLVSRDKNRRVDLDCLFPGASATWSTRIADCLKSGQGAVFAGGHQLADRWFRVVLWPTDDLACTVVFTDITEQIQNASRLADTASALQSMLDAIQETAGVVDRTGKILMINQTGARRYNAQPADLVGTNPFERSDPAWASRKSNLRKVIRGQQAVVFEDVRDGRAYQNCMYPIRDSSGRVDRVAVVGIDITERRRAEKRVREADERLRQVLQQSADGVLLVDTRGAVVELNKATEALFGIHREGILGKTSREIALRYTAAARRKAPEPAAPITVLCNLLRKSTEGPFPNFCADTLHTASGKTVHIETMWSRIRNGSLEVYAAFIRDVTQLREAQHGRATANQALEQKNAALREILSHIEDERSRVETRVQTQVDSFLLPLVHRLKLRSTPSDLSTVGLLESHLRELTHAAPSRVHASLTTLTSRELELLEMIKRDLSNKEIGQLLRVSPRTIELHRTRIRKKLGLTGRAVRLPAHLRSL